MLCLSKPFPVTTKSEECGGRTTGTVCAVAGQRFLFCWSLCVSCEDLLVKDSAESCSQKIREHFWVDEQKVMGNLSQEWNVTYLCS